MNFNHLQEMFEKKNQDYGNAYETIGEILIKLFPGGVALTDSISLSEFSIFSILIGKVCRYAQLQTGRKANFESLADTLDDLSIYGQILKELNKLQQKRMEANNADRREDQVGAEEVSGPGVGEQGSQRSDSSDASGQVDPPYSESRS